MQSKSSLVVALFAAAGLAGSFGVAAAQTVPATDASGYNTSGPGADNGLMPVVTPTVPNLAAAATGSLANTAGSPTSEALLNTSGPAAANGERAGHLGLGRGAMITASRIHVAPPSLQGTQPTDGQFYNTSGPGAANGTNPGLNS